METFQKQILEYLLMINKVENKILHLFVLKNSNSVSKFGTNIKQENKKNIQKR